MIEKHVELELVSSHYGTKRHAEDRYDERLNTVDQTGEPDSQSDDIDDDDDDNDTGNVAGSVGAVPTTAIKCSRSDRQIRDVFASFNDGEINISPAFQRQYVWDFTRAVQLIESVFLKIPLPPIYTVESAAGGEEVIDGQQRLATLMGFLANKFPGGQRNFRLRRLKVLTAFEGKCFADLALEDQRAFRSYCLDIIKIDHGANEDAKFTMFERLNSGAITLNPQELRNCLYYGPLNDLIVELAKHRAFTRFPLAVRNNQRMQDCEHVLRFLALNHRSFLNYKASMKKFLNEFMRANQRNVGDLPDWREAFLRACDNVSVVLGDKAFRRYHNGVWDSCLNRGLFDVTMFWFSRYEKRQIVAARDAIYDGVIDLMSHNADFNATLDRCTNNSSVFRNRFKLFGNMMESIITVPPGERRGFTLAERQVLFDANPVCAFCNQTVPSIDEAEVDHRIRYADGGPTVMDNARIAHRNCNRSQGKRL